MATVTFRDWLGAEMERQGLKRRALARRLAEKHPEGSNPNTVETYRRAIYKYLDASDPTIPTAPTRRAFAEALGVSPDTLPSEEEDEEDLDSALLRELMKQQADLNRKVNRYLERTARP